MKATLENLGFEHLPMLSEFVIAVELAQSKLDTIPADIGRLVNITEYTFFIRQPLTKGMFVPCGEDGEVLVEPKNYISWKHKRLNTPYDADLSKYEQYQQALGLCIFEERCMFNKGYNVYQQYETIEQAVNAGVKLKLK